MAKEEIKGTPTAEVEVFNPEKLEITEHTVLKKFTLYGELNPGNKISLPKGKIKDTLISNKLIK